MNVAFFLLPKDDVAHVTIDSTMRQALEKMEFHRYTAVPIIDENGGYVGTLTEGDLLWKMKEVDAFNLRDLEDIPLSSVKRRFSHKAVSIHAEVEELMTLAIDQSFVPVIDDQGIFIGIVTRKSVISFFMEDYFKPLRQTNEAQ